MIIQQIQKRQILSLAKIKKFQEGDYVTIEENENGGVTINPAIIVRPVDIKTLSKDWQEAIQKSKENIANEDYETFANMDNCIKNLEGLIKENVNNN